MLANYQQGPRICETPPLNPSKSWIYFMYTTKNQFQVNSSKELIKPKEAISEAKVNNLKQK